MLLIKEIQLGISKTMRKGTNLFQFPCRIKDFINSKKEMHDADTKFKPTTWIMH